MMGVCVSVCKFNFLNLLEFLKLLNETRKFEFYETVLEKKAPNKAGAECAIYLIFYHECDVEDVDWSTLHRVSQ